MTHENDARAQAMVLACEMLFAILRRAPESIEVKDGCRHMLYRIRDAALLGEAAGRERDALQVRVEELELKRAGDVKMLEERGRAIDSLKARAEAAESALNDIAEVLFGERPHGAMPSTTLDAVKALKATSERRKQERDDALGVKTKEGLTASEWLLRTGKAEREAKACRSYLEDTRAALGGNASDDVEALAMVRMSELEQAQTDRDFYKAAAASSFQGAVKAFHEAMGLPVESVPTMPDAKTRALRCRLQMEEALELCTASGFRVYSPGGVLLGKGDFVFEEDENHPADLAAMAHENADVLYIAFGSYVAMGVNGAAVFGEVHAANMRKLGPDGRPILNAAGKVLKPEGWKPADVASVLAKLGGRNE